MEYIEIVLSWFADLTPEGWFAVLFFSLIMIGIIGSTANGLILKQHKY